MQSRSEVNSKRLSNFFLLRSLLLIEKIVYLFWSHHLFHECIGTCFWRPDHFNSFGQSLWSGLHWSYWFLCHDSLLFYFFMNRHLFQNGIEFLQLHSIRCILFILGSDISWSTWLSAILMFGALQNHLNPISFLCHCSALWIWDLLLVQETLLPCFLDNSRDSSFIDVFEGRGRYL